MTAVDRPETGLHFACHYCGEWITEPGALLFGVPDIDDTVQKWHVCVDCYPKLVNVDLPNRPSRDPERPEGVPQDAVPMVGWWVGRENASAVCVVYSPDGGEFRAWSAASVRACGQPVPPYQEPTLERTAEIGPWTLSESEVRDLASFSDEMLDRWDITAIRNIVALAREVVAGWTEEAQP